MPALPFWRRYLNLAQPRLGARVAAVSDEFFGAAERLLRPEPPVFVPDRYDDHGKWMDGWESRRRRDAGHDWCVVELGAPSLLLGVDIDTTHFDGNQPEAASLEGAHVPSSRSPSEADWFELLGRAELAASRSHPHRLAIPAVVTHARLNIFPDGGVARLRLYGRVHQDWPSRGAGDHEVDLVAAESGGEVVAVSDEHFGSASNLLLPGRGVDMGDGWETARRRGPGFDWVVLRLGCPGEAVGVVIDTAHFKGNFPHQCSVQGALFPRSLEAIEREPEGSDEEDGLDAEAVVRAERASRDWPELLPRQLMEADHEHRLELDRPAAISHVRLNMIPDGGISRLRLLGRPRAELDEGRRAG